MRPFREEVQRTIARAVYVAMHIEHRTTESIDPDAVYSLIASDARAYAITSRATAEIMTAVWERMQ